MMKIRKRHGRINKLIRPFLMGKLNKKFNVRCEKSDLKPPFLVFSNHVTDYDAFFVANSFKCPIYFLMSDHITTIPFVGKLIRFLVSPLPITKSSIDASAVREIISAVNQGGAVGIFPEGNKSWAGDVSWIKPSTVKLIKKLNVPVVLYNVVGGYLSSPRWTKNKRKGKIDGKINKILTPKDIQNMSNDELYSVLVEGLRVNAYECQANEKIEFVGKTLADGIENMLYACPECGKISTLEGIDDTIHCHYCKKDCKLNSFGYVEGGKFDRLDKWNEWQKQHIVGMNLANTPINTRLLFDEHWEVAKKDTKYKSEILGMFSSSLYVDKLILENEKDKIDIDLNDIAGMAIEGVNGIQLWLKNGDVFRLKNKTKVSGLKYVNFIWAIKGEPFKF